MKTFRFITLFLVTTFFIQPAHAVVVTGSGSRVDATAATPVTTVNQELISTIHNGQDVTTVLANVLTPLPNNQTQVETTAVAYGKGVNIRGWEVQNPVFIDGQQNQILPVGGVERVEIFKGPQGTLYGKDLFGAKYGKYGDYALTSPGQSISLGSKINFNSTANSGITLPGYKPSDSLWATRSKFLINQDMNYLLGRQGQAGYDPKNPIQIRSPFSNYNFSGDAWNQDKKVKIRIRIPISYTPTGVTTPQVTPNLNPIQAQQSYNIQPQLLHFSQPYRSANLDYAFVFTPQPNNTTKIEASTIAYGRGADFRAWEIQYRSPYIMGPNKDRILPMDTQKIYIPKSSFAAPVAPYLFAAIGSQYEGPGKVAGDHPGQVCPVTGQPLGGEGGSSERGPIASGIDKAGMAAGLGLLTSQAKGEIAGIKTTYIINANMSDLLGRNGVGQIPMMNYLFKGEAQNKNNKELIIFSTPIITPISDNQ